MAAILAAGYALNFAIEAIGAVLSPLGVRRRAIRAAYRLMLYARTPRPPGAGPAGRAVRRAAPIYRAMYLVAAAQRLNRRLDGEGAERAVRNERRYLRAHINAQSRRADAAREVDEAAQASARVGAGRRFRWVAAPEPGVCVPIGGRTCASLAGTVWAVEHPPDGTWPGLRHYGCKCRAVPVGGHTMYSPQPRLRFMV